MSSDKGSMIINPARSIILPAKADTYQSRSDHALQHALIMDSSSCFADRFAACGMAVRINQLNQPDERYGCPPQR